MPMSKDCIEFTAYAPERDERITAEAMVKAFGLTFHRATMAIKDGERIRCRPSQFGRFIVYRFEAGIPVNNIRHLDPVIVPAVSPALDVSGFPARHEAKINDSVEA